MKKLIIAEKASVGRTIAKVVGADKSHEGYLEGPGYIVSWCRGHLLENADTAVYNPKYRQWELEDIPIIPDVWKVVPREDSKADLDRLVELALRDDVGSLIEATDAGREGELIFRLVYDHMKSEAGKRGITFRKPFERLWVSSLEAGAIKAGMENLKPSSEYDSLYLAALSRSRADWLFGINGTRVYTLVSGSGMLRSVGRVQTPTLAMVVQRQREIEGFKVQNRWAVVKEMGTWTMETELFTDEQAARRCLTETAGKPVVIGDVTKAMKKQSPPLLHSLTSLQQAANSAFGFTAKKTLDVMEQLYLGKVLSYPRTDSNHITSDMAGTMAGIVSNLGSSEAFGNLAGGQEWKSQGVKRLVDDSKVGDHYAVIVTETFARNPDLSKLKPDEEKIVRLVVTRILESVAPWYEYESTSVAGECAGYGFSGNGTKVIVKGWKAVAPLLLRDASKGRDTKKESILPEDLAKGKSYDAIGATLAERNTKPPAPYTEATLLGAMEKAGAKEMDDGVERKGLGTSSTRAGTIETLLARKYIVRKGKALLATEEGKALIDEVSDGFKNVDTTVDWENRLLRMERGSGETLEAFCTSVSDEIRRLVGSLPGVSQGGIVLGRCPVCGGDVIQSSQGGTCKGCGRRLYRLSKPFRRAFTNDEIRKMLEGGQVKVTGWSEKSKLKFRSLASKDKKKPAENEECIMYRWDFLCRRNEISCRKSRDVPHLRRQSDNHFCRCEVRSLLVSALKNEQPLQTVVPG